MDTTILSKLLSDAGPMIIGATIGAGIIYITRSTQTNASSLRSSLGQDLALFADVPPDIFEAAIDAQLARTSRLRPIFGLAIIVVGAGLSSSLYRLLWPAEPHWHSFLVGGAVAGLLGYIIDRIERRLTIAGLRRLISEQTPTL